MQKRIILHIDVNNAFLSWTAIEMLKNGSRIDIRNRYAVIGGDEDSRRGIVLAKSNLCKAKGVVTGESLYIARKKCPRLEVYRGERDSYKKYSDLMYNYLLQYTNIIERYSIDECFLDYTYSVNLFGDPIKLAYKIKDDIKNKFGFTVNVGIGNNKLLAKMASDFSKPDKVHTLFSDEIKSKMWILPINDLFMLGKASANKLYEMGYKTIGDIASSDVNVLIKYFKSHGKMMWEFANGIDNSEVSYIEHDAKSISASTVLPFNYIKRDEMLKIMRSLSMEVGRKLRDSGMYAMNVSIWIKYSNFIKVSKQINLDNVVHTDNEIYESSIKLFDKLWNKEDTVRGLCVRVSNLRSDNNRQLSLFDISNNNDNKNIKGLEKDDKLQKVMDEIRNKYGNDKIMYADMIVKKK